MRKAAIVTLLGAFLLVGAVVLAAPPAGPTIRATAVCTDLFTGDTINIFGQALPVPNSGFVNAFTDACPPGRAMTGGGYIVLPLDARVRVTRSLLTPRTTGDIWIVSANR